ncbi:50S ribosomal protein L10 [Syntrophomonas curvata]
MPNLEQKEQIVKDIEKKLQDATLVVFTDYRGLNVEEMTSLREKLRVPGVEYKVLKNTMVEFALKNTGHEDIIPHTFGPNAVLFSNEDPVGPVKSIYEFIKQYKKLEVKAGILEGQAIAPEKIKSLADLPPREVLLAQVVGTMQAPITSLAYVLNANLSGFARVIDQIREQKQAS